MDGAFQSDAFQSDAFQLDSDCLPGFQSDAFQADAFQMCVEDVVASTGHPPRRTGLGYSQPPDYTDDEFLPLLIA